jgi:hypothetical protein
MLALLLLSAASSLASAALISNDENVIVGLHAENGFYGVAGLDTNHFNQGDKYMGIYRYGYGHGGFSLGNGIGLRMQSNSGWRWLGGLREAEGIAPIVALEGGGHLQYNTNSLIHSYYQWTPGLAFGIQTNAKGWRTTMVVQAGPTIGNYSSPNMIPYIESRIGAGFYTNAGPLNLGGTLSRIGPHSGLSVDLLIKVDGFYLGSRYEHSEGAGKPDSNAFFLLVTQPMW